LNFRALEIFCCVAEHRSFSAAATELSLSQGAVSLSIQQLEESLGVALFDRSTRPPALTAGGSRFLEGARGILNTYQRLSEQVRRIESDAPGEICIGSIVSVGLSYLPAATAEFARLYPTAVVNTTYGTSERVIEMVTRGEVDFGMVSFPRSTKTIEAVNWLDEPMRIFCSGRHRLADCRSVSVEQLCGTDMIGFAKTLELRHQIDRVLSAAGIAVNVRMEFDNTDSMIRAIVATGGIGILPEAAVRRETADGSLRVVACREFRMSRPLGMIFRRSGRLSAATNEFCSLLLGRPIESEIRRRKSSTNKKSTVSKNEQVSVVV
jgi:DNA-binding transcriptional LysR family regulator